MCALHRQFGTFLHEHSSGYSVWRQRHPPLANVARRLSEAIPEADGRSDSRPADSVPPSTHSRRCGPHRRHQQRTTLPGRGTAPPGQHHSVIDRARAGRPQHRARNRDRRAARSARIPRRTAAGTAVGPRHPQRARIHRCGQ